MGKAILGLAPRVNLERNIYTSESSCYFLKKTSSRTLPQKETRPSASFTTTMI